MTPSSLIVGAQAGQLVEQPGRMCNRHGLIAGATGTGKTVTLQTLAEGFSRMGTPVFAVDVKGDLSGIADAGQRDGRIDARLAEIPLPAYRPQPSPVLFWDVDGLTGQPLRATISDMGPLLLGHLLALNDTQTGVLYAGFDIADRQGLLLLDLKDLRALLAWMGENAASLGPAYGHISGASIGAIQRRLLVLEEQGAERFFGEPALQLADLMLTDNSGRGMVSLLDARRLIHQAPRVYAATLFWLLSALFEQLPEVGDRPAPRLVLFFDEAHLLFSRTSRALIEKIEQVVRLIRSKGVGVYFVTQSPLDIPDAILGQLGLKIQHALRAFTPKDQKVVRAVAASFVPNPQFDTAGSLTSLGIGEALVSVLDQHGRPQPVRRTLIAPPEGRIGALADRARTVVLLKSPLHGRYDTALDRQSAYEMLEQRAQTARQAEAELARELDAERNRRQTGQRSSARRSGRQTPAEAMLTSAARSIGSSIGRQIVRGVLGSLLGKR